MGNPLFAKKKAVVAPSGDETVEEKASSPLKVLIIDDETEVHRVTDLTLKRFRFDGKKIQFLHAYSGKEAMEIFDTETDIALALVDVVMETDHAGLDVVHYVRKDLQNNACRLVLRTGQPGLWFIAGSLAQCRIFSKTLALQIKAINEGLLSS